MLYIGTTILGLFYFLVYIGAIAVLFLFSIMILDLKDFVYEYDYSIFINVFFFLFIISIQFFLLVSKINFFLISSSYEYFFSTNEYLLILGILIFNKYNFVLLLVAIILLLAMVGSIHLTNKKKGFFIKKELFILSRNHNIYHCLVY
jgi:NADH:ubiquinone oxidoreductase subunit 6 (subunit J)